MPLRGEEVARILRDAKHEGKLSDASGVGKEAHPLCDDEVHFYIKVEGEVIKEARFEAYNCAAAIASSEILAGLAEGRSIAEAENLSLADIERAAGGLPKINRCCKEVGVHALKKAIASYRGQAYS
ncbi:iron-sulfur cluster assembly scaffold protein [Candidatus Pyrohabitans sp.]